jgi:hypothetical protein
MYKARYIVFVLALTASSVITAVGAERPYGPDTCRQGYVWREAFAGDHVCVSPAIRTQAARDNDQVNARKEPRGGHSGPDTCRPSFVWREATPNDHVCVTPETRAQAADDNKLAWCRKASSLKIKGSRPPGCG